MDANTKAQADSAIKAIKNKQPITREQLSALAQAPDSERWISQAARNNLYAPAQTSRSKELEAQLSVNRPYGGGMVNTNVLNGPEEKDIGKLVNNLPIQRPYNARVGDNPGATAKPSAETPSWTDFRQAELAKDDSNGDGKIDAKDLPAVTTDPNTGADQYVFTEAQLMKMMEGFGSKMINPNSNIDGAPQTSWATYANEAEAFKAQAAQQQEKDKALAALAAMKNS